MTSSSSSSSTCFCIPVRISSLKISQFSKKVFQWELFYPLKRNLISFKNIFDAGFLTKDWFLRYPDTESLDTGYCFTENPEILTHFSYQFWPFYYWKIEKWTFKKCFSKDVTLNLLLWQGNKCEMSKNVAGLTVRLINQKRLFQLISSEIKKNLLTFTQISAVWHILNISKHPVS